MKKQDAKKRSENMSIEEAERILASVTETEKMKRSNVNKVFIKSQTFDLMKGMIKEVKESGRKTIPPLAAQNLLIDFA